MKNLLKYLIIGILINLITIPVISAQGLEVKWAPKKDKVGGMLGYYEKFGITKDHYYVYYSKGKTSKLLKYDFENKLKKEIPLVSSKKQEIVLRELVQTSSGLYAYCTKYSKKNKELTVIMSPFNDGEIDYSQEVLQHHSAKQVTLSTIVSGTQFHISKDNKKQIQVSPNGERVLYLGSSTEKGKKKKDKIKIGVFNAEMELSWEKNYELPYQDNDFDIEQTVINDRGEVFLIAIHYSKEKKRNVKIPNYDYKLIKLTRDGMQEMNIDLETGKYVTSVKMVPNNKSNEISVTGFYKHESKKNGIQGVFVSKMDISKNQTINTSVHKFEQSFLEEKLSEKEIEKEVGLSLFYKVDDIVLFEDESFAFIAEKRFSDQFSIPKSDGSTKTYNVYFAQYIVIPVFDKSGALKKITNISKAYSDRQLADISYTLGHSNDQIYLLFPEGKSKKEIKKKAKAKKGKKGKGKSKQQSKKYIGSAELAVIDKNGDLLYKKEVFDFSKFGMPLSISLSEFDNNKLLIGAQSLKRYRFGIFDLSIK